MSNCTDYIHYQICNTFNNEHSTNKLNYKTTITIFVEDKHKSVVDELLEKACNVMKVARGATPYLPETHRNSLTNRVNRIIENNIIYEILKAFSIIYQKNKEHLNDIIKSEEGKVDKFVYDLAKNLTIKVSNPTSGGFCLMGLCRNSSQQTVISPVKQNVKKSFEFELTNKINTFFTSDDGDTAEDKLNMLEKISSLITKRDNVNVVQAGGVLPTRLAPRASFSAKPVSRESPYHTTHQAHRGVRNNIPFSTRPVQDMTYRLNATENMSFHSTPTNINFANSAKQSTHLAFNTNMNNIHIDQQTSSIQEFELMTEINDRIQNLENIHKFFSTNVHNSLTVGELLLLDRNVVLEDIQEGYATLNNFVKGQTGGGKIADNTDMITALYALDVKTAKYEQMIAYRTYALYTNTLATPQNGGGIGDFLKNIHHKFTSYSFSEKINALQSLGKSLIVYVFQRVLKKLKLPNEIAELSVVEDAEEYFDIVAQYIANTYNKGSIITQKYALYTKLQHNERQRQITQMNIDIIDGLIGFATLINMFRDASFDNTNTTSDMLSNLGFLIDNLQKFKDALHNGNNKTITDFTKEFKALIRRLNPQMASAEEYTLHQNEANVKKSLEKNLRGFEAYDKEIREGKHTNVKLQEYIDYRNNFEKKLGNDYNNFAEDAEVMETIDLSQQLLIRIAKTFTVNHLTKSQLDELKEAGSKVLEDVMDTGFVKNTLESVKTGFASFLSSMPWMNSIVHMLKILAPFATIFGNILTFVNPIGFFIVVINLCIVALHYTVKLSVFFWRKYAKKTNFNPDEFLNELKERTSVRQRGGKTVRFVTTKSKTRTSKHTLKGGVGFLPALSHPKSSIQQVHDTMKSAQSSLPSIQGVKLPLIQQKGSTPKQVSDTDDVEILSKIADTIIYDISKYSNATQKSYELIPSDITEMASALQILITSDTVDINEIYSQSQRGGKPKRTIRTKHTLLQSKTKKELIAHAKSKGIRVKSADRKDDIIKAISIRRYKK
jgi:hypothetical protein